MPGRAPFVVAACLVLVLARPAHAQEEEGIGRVADLTGPAVVLRERGPQALYRGARIYREDRLRTLETAKLKIVFADGSELVVGADSKVNIARYAPDEGEGVLQLLRGILRAVVPDSTRWERFDLQTRNAVASARSTEWIVVLTLERTSVFVIDGAVDVSAAGGQVRLRNGDGTDIPVGAAPGDPVQWGQARVSRALTRTTLR
jgi:hypothetical protein